MRFVKNWLVRLRHIPLQMMHVSHAQIMVKYSWPKKNCMKFLMLSAEWYALQMKHHATMTQCTNSLQLISSDNLTYRMNHAIIMVGIIFVPILIAWFWYTRTKFQFKIPFKKSNWESEIQNKVLFYIFDFSFEFLFWVLILVLNFKVDF